MCLCVCYILFIYSVAAVVRQVDAGEEVILEVAVEDVAAAAVVRRVDVVGLRVVAVVAPSVEAAALEGVEAGFEDHTPFTCCFTIQKA
jgi:hypothetical protein